jgi:hypothetical protein
MNQSVITYQSPRGRTISMCQAHQAQFKRTQQWPYDPSDGQEYCTVSKGRHQGICNYCDDQE